IALVHPWGALPLGPTEPAVVEALRTLTGREVPLSTLDELVDGADPVRLAQWFLVLDAVSGLFVHELRLAGSTLMRSFPLAVDATHRRSEWPAGALARLSRFTLLHRTDAGMIAESPLSYRRVVLDDPAARQVATELAAPVGLVELAVAVPSEHPA